MSLSQRDTQDVADVHTSIQLDAAPTSAGPREHRMFMALLWACDPCRYVARDGSVAAYRDLAARAVVELNTKPRPRAGDLVSVFDDHADRASAAQFATAALDWWAHRIGSR